ncbi:MAG: hypothetical protein JWP03_778 [Phycisphaerales bacterium]|nr:hypothetical protein [Phycisphaerales bacterium]
MPDSAIPGPIGKASAKNKPTLPHRLRKFALRLAVVILALAIGGELFCRFYLGMGDPPLMMADPQMEYLFKPSRTYHRFGHRISYNAYSMRSDDFPLRKSDPDEFRVLVIGDSVVNGGARVDQSELVTSRLQQQLRQDLGCPVIVGNISAGSWGPPNELAYIKRFGLFSADVVVLVLNSDDYRDLPTFSPVVGVNPNFPDRAPPSALLEAITRGVHDYIPWLYPASPTDAPEPTATPDTVRQCLDAEREIFRMARDGNAAVFLMQYQAADEMGDTKEPGYAEIKAVGKECNVPIIETGPSFAAALAGGATLFRDPIHPNAAGHKIMADLLLKPVEDVARSRQAGAATPDAATPGTSKGKGPQ